MLKAVPDAAPDAAKRMWHVTLTAAGPLVDRDSVRAGLERLAHEHPFLLDGRYAADRAEVRYWDESPDIDGAIAHATGLWAMHRASAGLPDWQVVGVEVLDQDTFHRRAVGARATGLFAAGRVLPF